MFTLITTVLLASLVGSLHCAGMCGPFVALSVGIGQDRIARHLALQATYHGGRLVSYLLLGLAAGALGAALDLGGMFFGLQRVALASAGVLMILAGLVLLGRQAGLRVKSVAPPRRLQELLRRMQTLALRQQPQKRALLVGLFSTFLPCGWLYAFVVVAAGTGSALGGVVAMAAFWAGTVPVLAVVGASIRTVAGPLRRHLPTLSALALLLVGVMALAGRLDIPALRVEENSAATPDQAADQVHGIDQEALPCCGGKPP